MVDERRGGVHGQRLGGLVGIAAGDRCRLWMMRVDSGPDDATERVVDDRDVGSGLGDVGVRRRGVFCGGAGLLAEGEK